MELIHDFSPGEDRYDMQMSLSGEGYYLIRVEFADGIVETREFQTELFSLTYANVYAEKDTFEIKLTPYNKRANYLFAPYNAKIFIYKDGETIVVIDYEKFDSNYQTKNVITILDEMSVRISSNIVKAKVR